MHALSPHERRLALSLSALAGLVDAVAYLELDRYFVSFMSGNSTRMGVGLLLSPREAFAAGSLILGFVLGVVSGSVFGRLIGHHRRPGCLILTAALLAAAAACGAGPAASAAGVLTAMAMGTENAVFENDGDIRIGVTYMTGSLVRVGQRIAAAMFGGPPFGWLPYLMLWASLVFGAALGAALHMRLGLSALWIASLCALALAVWAWTGRRTGLEH
jgi:uncharacterized membrane protein YoaK (UPF0700 family)